MKRSRKRKRGRQLDGKTHCLLSRSIRSTSCLPAAGISGLCAGASLSNGAECHPIALRRTALAIRDADLAPFFKTYVAAGGFLLVGSFPSTRPTQRCVPRRSSFARNE